MTLLSILRFSRKQPAETEISHAWEKRAAERFDVHLPVLIGPPGGMQVSATVINLSANGAAVRVNGWKTMPRPRWLERLNQSDELWLAELLPNTIRCWVITFDDGVFRVHFAQDPALWRELSELPGARH